MLALAALRAGLVGVFPRQVAAGTPVLLAGSMWLFVVGVGSPLACRPEGSCLPIFDTRAAVPLRLDGADLCILWSAFSTAGCGLLAGLRQEAGSREERPSECGGDITAGFCGIAVIATLVLVFLAPWRRRCCRAGELPYRRGWRWHSVHCS